MLCWKKLLRCIRPLLPFLLLLLVVIPFCLLLIIENVTLKVIESATEERPAANTGGDMVKLTVTDKPINPPNTTTSITSTTAKPFVSESPKVGSLKHLLQPQVPIRDEDISIIGESKPEVFLTIGVPTIYRPEAGFIYLKGTLQSLVDNTTPTDKNDSVVLVFLADFDASNKANIVQHIKKFYQEHLDSGFIQIMQVQREAYPPLENLKRNYKDADMRVRWRSKQVCDFAFMFYHARKLSKYVMQIEDDIIAAPSFVSHVRSFISSQQNPWVTLQFSALGYIGKLHKSSDLEQYVKFLLLFYQEMPVDWLLTIFPRLLSHPEMPLRKPTLFQHRGEHSSLKSKHLNKLMDKFFAGAPKKFMPIPKSHPEANNPPADVYTDLQTYEKHTPANAYLVNGDSYFWSKKPNEGNSFSVVFHNPVRLKRVYVETGHSFQTNDFLRNGVLEVSDRCGNFSEDHRKCFSCMGHKVLGRFQVGSLDVMDLQKTHNVSVKCLRIRVTKNQEEWIIIKEISVMTV